MYHVHSVPISLNISSLLQAPSTLWIDGQGPNILYIHLVFTCTPDMYCLIRTGFLFLLISVCLSECTYSTVMYVSLSLGSVCCWYLCLSVCTVLYTCLHVCLYVCFFVCLSVSLSLLLFACLLVCLIICLSVWLSVCLSLNQSFCLSVCLTVSLPICLLVCLCLSACLTVCQSDCLSLSLSVVHVGVNTCHAECKYVNLPSYRPACLSVSLSLSLMFMSLTVCPSACLFAFSWVFLTVQVST